MAKVVWKYTLTPGRNAISTPGGAEFLYATAQHDEVVAYALVDPRMLGTECHYLYVVGTGIEIDDGLPDRLKPLGVASLDSGRFMIHVFEETFAS